MATVYLVRHGQASFGSADYDNLSELGRHQAQIVGAALRARGVRVDVAVSGTMRRQVDTAAVCLAAAGLPPDCPTDPRWNEYDFADILVHHGPPDAMSARESRDGQPGGDPRAFQAALDAGLLRWIAAGEGSPAARTWPAFAGGIAGAMAGLMATLGSGRTGVVFTSGGVIAAACAGLLGLTGEGCVALNRVTVNGGITKVVNGRAGTSLVSFNEHAHFEGEGRRFLTYR